MDEESPTASRDANSGFLKGLGLSFDDRITRPDIEGQIFRVFVRGKSMHADAIRDVFKLVRKDEEFAIDVDILVEMYLVNTTERKQYVRGFNFTWEVDGKALPLILQKDFYAYELDGTHYEYCLNISPNQLDHSKLETLPPLYPRLPLELEARRPLEGWVHFVIKDADPEKVYKNHSYKFSVVDSLDNEHPILKAIMDDRAGTISVRRILANA